MIERKNIDNRDDIEKHLNVKKYRLPESVETRVYGLTNYGGEYHDIFCFSTATKK